MIRLVTVIGHGVELLPHFIKHYQMYVDQIQIVVYENELNPNIKSEIEEIISEHRNVKIVKTVYERVFDWELVTKLYNEVKLFKPNDWWVVADIDEFHYYPENKLRNLIAECNTNGWDLVRGGFIDRIGQFGFFGRIRSDASLFEQFPMMGFFRYPMSGACPNKVCVMKGYVELTNGQHYANINGQTTWRWQGWNHPLIAPYQTHSVQVHHFKWDSKCAERIKAVADVKRDYAYSGEYQIMYDKLKKCNFKIDVDNPEFMFEEGGDDHFLEEYEGWNNLINKIVSI